MGKFSDARVDRAAGGVVLGESGEGRVVAVVHRPRYDDWALPKGHVDPGESWKQTALREVLEETGVQAAITGPPIVISYMIDDDLPKIVVFYPMVPVEGSEQHDPDEAEVDVVEWWTIDRATRELTYVDERSVVARLVGPA